MNQRESFLLYKAFYKPIKNLPQKDKADLLDAIFMYQTEGVEIELSPSASMAFDFFINQFRLDDSKYQQKCIKNKENAKKRWDATACDRIRTDAIDADKDNEKDKGKDKGKDKEKIPPSLQDVTEYCSERNNGINPQHFIDFYEARGWKLGNRKLMVSWKACVRTWENNKKGEKDGRKLTNFEKMLEGQRLAGLRE